MDELTEDKYEKLEKRVRDVYFMAENMISELYGTELEIINSDDDYKDLIMTERRQFLNETLRFLFNAMLKDL